MQYAITNDVIDRAWFSAREPMGCCAPIGGPGPYRLCCYPPAERVSGQCSEYGPQFFAGLLQTLADRKLSLILQTAADQYVTGNVHGNVFGRRRNAFEYLGLSCFEHKEREGIRGVE
jgi:hypothetical protein